MTWKQLQKDNRVQPHTTSNQELNDLRKLVDRDLKDAVLAGLSADRKFATAYNAILQLAKMAIACSGYRVLPKGGQHQTSFDALKLSMGRSIFDLADYFDTCRRKRNTVDYDFVDVVSQTEADELYQKALEFRKILGKCRGNPRQFIAGMKAA